MSEQAFRAAQMMQSAADDARRASNSISESVDRLRPLFEDGYGGIAFRLVELLEAENLRIMESQDAKIMESHNHGIIESHDSLIIMLGEVTGSLQAMLRSRVIRQSDFATNKVQCMIDKVSAVISTLEGNKE
jgi:hypothetical protein